MNLEGHLSKLAIERQSFFNMKFELENQILEKDDLIVEKNTQISMLKAQINILMRELDEAKKNSHQDGGLSSLTPLKMVKRIRGGNHQASSKNMTSLTGDYNETEATEMPSGRIQNPSYKQGGTFITTANSIFTHRSTNNKTESIEVVDPNPDIQETVLKPQQSDAEPQEKQLDKTMKLTKEEEKAKISQSIEEFKKLHLAKNRKTSQGAQGASLSDRRGSESLFGQFKTFITGNNPTSQ